MTYLIDYLLPGRRILAKLDLILKKEMQIMAVLDDLKAAVADEEAIASGDPAALTALSTDIGARTKALSDAVAANTPAPPPAA